MNLYQKISEVLTTNFWRGLLEDDDPGTGVGVVGLLWERVIDLGDAIKAQDWEEAHILWHDVYECAYAIEAVLTDEVLEAVTYDD